MHRLPCFCLCLCVAVVYPHAGGQESTQPSIKSNVDVVSVYFTVRDSHKRLLDDLDQAQFQVREDGHAQTIKFFSHHSDIPLNVGVLLDTGTSTPATLALEADATGMFMDRVVRPKDLGFLVSYANRVQTLQVPTADVALLKDQAQEIRSTAPVTVAT